MSDVLPYQVSNPNLAQRVAVAAITTGARLLSKAPPRTLRHALQIVCTGARPASYRETRAARDVVLTVSAYARGGSACLPRSIATALLCRVRGVWPETLLRRLRCRKTNRGSSVYRSGKACRCPQSVCESSIEILSSYRGRREFSSV